jgi:GlcNAc-P-P-Und epimerase
MTKQGIRVLVTGGSGFIGTNLVRYYLDEAVTVINLDAVAPRDKDQISLWKKVDIIDPIAVRQAILEFAPTHIYHLAARTDLDEKKNIEGYAANTVGVSNILAAATACLSLRRIMFTSSMFVCYPGYDPKDYSDYAPHTVYGESKVLTESIVHGADLTKEWFIVRPTSIYGPWFGSPYNEFFHHVKNGTFFDIQGKTATKTYGFIGNAVFQMHTLMFADQTLVNGKTFYLGDYEALNINRWGLEIARQLNKKLRKIPLFALKAGAIVGDLLLHIGLKFPLQSFRLKNMTTDNVINLLSDTKQIIPRLPYSTEQGVSITLDWLKNNDRNFQN